MFGKLKSSASVATIIVATGLTASPLAVPAHAGGLNKPASPVVAQAMWSGFYAGTHMGAGEAHWDGVFNGVDNTPPFPRSDSTVLIDLLNTNGVFGGMHAGFNWDHGRYVFGIEGDISFMDWKDVAKAPSGSEELTGELDILASLRGRIGVAIGDERSVLLYGTAGVAFTDAEAVAYDSGVADAQGGFAHDVGDVGVVLGTGFEWAATDRFRVRAEGLYYWFDDSTTITGPAVADPGDSVELEDVFVVRIGGSWRFNGPS